MDSPEDPRNLILCTCEKYCDGGKLVSERMFRRHATFRPQSLLPPEISRMLQQPSSSGSQFMPSSVPFSQALPTALLLSCMANTALLSLSSRMTNTSSGTELVS
ncbi:hypothetical protein PAXRUDRAFT_642502 [Paxillus rubicundulus Ve08.2h10]|uniref:Uncharacterized protein n=1 Tax=Paxillus rubicundulus Ve08.2h10 TaxID=930991 RepID=A0A0D0D3Y1_9AGAM|nr:hypothetical protein PAXRUDRAFT_642502 [Paxillus rubicundulus Ve08.2h10]